MQSLYTNIIGVLETATFSVPNVTVRRPFDERPKTYPALVVHEITNIPASHGTVTGEATTVLAYQIDILTKTYRVDGPDIVVSRYDAGRTLLAEVSDLLDGRFKLTRLHTPPPDSPAPDVMRHIWRGEATLDSSGYSYRT